MPKWTDKRLAPVPETGPIGEALEKLSADERLKLALQVINQTDMTPEEKVRLEQRILNDDAESSSERLDENSPTTNSTPTSSPEASWTPDPLNMLVRTEDDPAFTRETCLRFLVILDQSMRDMAAMQEAIADQDNAELGSLALQQQMVLYEAARTVAIQLHMIASTPTPDLIMPDLSLIDQDGKRLSRKPKNNA